MGCRLCGRTESDTTEATWQQQQQQQVLLRLFKAPPPPKKVYGKVDIEVVPNAAFERMITWHPSLLPDESLHMRKAL